MGTLETKKKQELAGLTRAQEALSAAQSYGAHPASDALEAAANEVEELRRTLQGAFGDQAEADGSDSAHATSVPAQAAAVS